MRRPREPNARLEAGQACLIGQRQGPALVPRLATTESILGANRLAPELTYWTSGSFLVTLGDIVAQRGKLQRERLLVMAGGPGVDARS